MAHCSPDNSTSLLHFAANLPPKPYCSTDLSRLTIRPLKTALGYAYIQPNDPFNVFWLVFDMDLGKDSFHQFEDRGTATPNLVVQNPVNLNCHYLFLFKTPVWVNGTGRQAPQAYLNAIKNAMTRQLSADSRYRGLICKNPLSGEWRVSELHTRPYSLDDLAKHLDLSQSSIDLDRAKAEKRLSDSIMNGRNDRLFTLLRHFSYERVSRYLETSKDIGNSKAYDSWKNAIKHEANRINTEFPNGLQTSEINSTAKSVYSWTWEHYRPSKIQRGKMGFGETRHNFNFNAPMLTEDERKRRQSISAQVTNKHRKESTELQIRQAIERLKASNEKITNSAIAKQAGLNRQTMVKNYSDFIAEKVSLTVGIR